MSYSQAEMEALFSQRQVSPVLYESIKHELDGLFLNWSLAVWYKIQAYLEGEYYDSKNARIAELQKYVDRKGIEHIIIKILCTVLHTKTVQTFQQAIGYLQANLPHEDPFARAITAGELLALGASETRRGLYTIEQNDQDYSTVEVHKWPTIESRLLDSLEWVNSTGFNPPLVDPPLPVIDNRNCGYHTIQEPLILGNLTDHDLPQNYDAINTLNEIQWVLDPHVLAEPEVPGKPFEDRQAQQNFIDMCRESKFVYQLLGSDPFWLAWQYDSRGRIYSHGYHVNFQAAEYKKAMLNFNHYEELT